MEFSFGGFYPNDVRERFSAAISEDRFQIGPDRPERLVAVRSHVPVGFGSLRAGGEVAGIYVDPEAQGSGAGRLLLGAIEHLAKSRGVGMLALEATLNAVGFYERMGFQRLMPISHPIEAGGFMELVRMTKLI